MSRIPENIILSFATLIADEDGGVLEIGQELLEANADKLTDGGFWIWDIESEAEFYSPNFRKVLGFDGEHDFPSNSSSWQKQIFEEDLKVVFENYKKQLLDKTGGAFCQDVNYKKKHGGAIRVKCSGVIVSKRGKPKYLVGTHKILDNGSS